MMIAALVIIGCQVVPYVGEVCVSHPPLTPEAAIAVLKAGHSDRDVTGIALSTPPDPSAVPHTP